MGIFNYNDDEKEFNKVLKYNLDTSQALLTDIKSSSSRSICDANISSSEELLKSLGFESGISQARAQVSTYSSKSTLTHRPELQNWDDIVDEANHFIEADVILEDILSQEEISFAFQELEKIEKEFSIKTSIINKTDLSFLAIATGLQVAKSLIFPYIAEKFDYGKSFDTSKRLLHDDNSIKQAQKQANDKFRDKHSKKHGKGYWVNILYQTPPYDITKGSTALGINMEGKYHRLYTLGHDPILGWIFGTANILTDIITMNDFRSYRVTRKPSMLITSQAVSLPEMFSESYQCVKSDFLNLPAAIFAQAQHLKSDVNTKTGLPVPLLAAFNENFASNLYKKQYDSLCFARDIKIVGASYVVSIFIDTIIGLVHGLFKSEDEDAKLYEVRTRKILLISNAIASTSTTINACVTQNPKNLDIGSLLSTLTHLLTDIRFIAKIKQEFIENEIDKQLTEEFEEIDRLYGTI